MGHGSTPQGGEDQLIKAERLRVERLLDTYSRQARDGYAYITVEYTVSCSDFSAITRMLAYQWGYKMRHFQAVVVDAVIGYTAVMGRGE